MEIDPVLVAVWRRCEDHELVLLAVRVHRRDFSRRVSDLHVLVRYCLRNRASNHRFDGACARGFGGFGCSATGSFRRQKLSRWIP